MSAWRICALLVLSAIYATLAWGQASGSPELVVQTGHSSRVLTIGYSDDGKLLASGDDGGNVILWSADTGDQLRSWKAHSRHLASLAFGHQRTTLLTAGWDGFVRIWNPATGQPAGAAKNETLAHGGDPLDSVVLNLKVNRLVTSSNYGDKDRGIKIWDFSGGTMANPQALGSDSGGVSALAFSMDGKQLVSGGHDHTIKLWDIAHRTPIQTFDYVRPTEVKSVAFSPDGKRIASGGGGFGGHAPVELWSHRSNGSGMEATIFPTNDEWVATLAFSPGDGRWLIAGTNTSGKAIHLWDLSTHPVQERTLSTARNADVFALAFSPDGKHLASGGSDNAVTIRDAETWGEQTRRLQGHVRPITAIALNVEGQMLASAGRISRDVNTGDYRNAGDIKLWDLSGQTSPRLLPGDYGPVDALVFSPNGDRLVSAHGGWGEIKSWDATRGKEVSRPLPPQITLWDTTSGKQLKAMPLPQIANVNLAGCLAWSKDGKWVASGGYDRLIRIWNAETLEGRPPLPEQIDVVRALAFSPVDSDLLASATRSDMTIHLWNITTRQMKTLGSDDLKGHSVQSLAFSPDGTLLASGTTDGRVQLWDISSPEKPMKTWKAAIDDSGEEPSLIDHAINTLVFFPDGKRLASGSQDNMINVWDVESESDQPPLLHLPGPTGAVTGLAISKDMLWSGGRDAQIRLWDTAKERKSANEANSNAKDLSIVRLIPLDDTDWVVVDPEGRFDSDNLEQIPSVRWILPGEPFRPLPPEIFMRDYYEPGLLRRRVACAEKQHEDPNACAKAFDPIPPLSQLNRVQPVVKISGIRPGASADEVLVDVEARGRRDASQTNGKTETEAHDLRLFRNGQLVGQWPAPTGKIIGAGDLETWKTESKVPDPRHTFHVRLSSKDRGHTVTFTAYAFNDARVKSETAKASYTALLEIPLRKPKAYVLAIGIDGYEDPKRELEFAVKDAKDIASALRRIEGYEVVPVALVSEAAAAPAQLNQATKANIRALISVLAGGSIDTNMLAGVANVDKLAKATPDDLVILFFSGHGHTENNGAFYLLPSDSGAEDTITKGMLKKFISSEELSEWLREVDAGQMAMIIDACHSAASVQSPGTKPGPMGDRGLGQLAYDKGMQILAASQANDVALEIRSLQQGLLTYALLREGLSPGKTDNLAADLNGDGILTLAEWLKYGERRTPALEEEARVGNVPTLAVPTYSAALKDSRPIQTQGDPDASSKRTQTPSFFDFHKQADEIVLRRTTKQQ